MRKLILAFLFMPCYGDTMGLLPQSVCLIPNSAIVRALLKEIDKKSSITISAPERAKRGRSLPLR